MCLENFISIRGECSNAEHYIDDLPGINIVYAAASTNESLLRPIDLINKAFDLAQKEVISDLFGILKLNYNEIIDDKLHRAAGVYYYFGEITETAFIKVYYTLNDKFVNLHVFDFEIISDRAITKDFTVSDGYGNIEVIPVDLNIGYNKITLNKSTNSEYIKITFDLSDFKIGIRESAYPYYNTDKTSCNTCYTSCNGCSYLETSHSNMGFNLSIRCEANECALLEYMKDQLYLPLLYKTGINYLLEVKLTDRINEYTLNKMDEINEILTLWMGGFNNETQTGVSSMYKNHLKNAALKLTHIISKINSPIFTHAGSFICNTLP